MARSFELDPVESLAVGTIGPPGRRQFFVRASGAGQSVVLNCEKVHVQGLIATLLQQLEEQGFKPFSAAGPVPEPAPPGEPEWTVGELRLGWHEGRRMFVIVARELSTQDRAAEELATARLWARPELLREFVRQAAAVVAAGRPLCRHCGLPIDPSGHPCPAANGSRPVV